MIVLTHFPQFQLFKPSKVREPGEFRNGEITVNSSMAKPLMITKPLIVAGGVGGLQLIGSPNWLGSIYRARVMVPVKLLSSSSHCNTK